MLTKPEAIRQALLAQYPLEAETLLVDIFMPLAYLEANLPQQMIDYVLTGNNDGVLAILDAIDNETGADLLSMPSAHFLPPYFDFDAPTDDEYYAWRELPEKCVAARRQLYLTLTRSFEPAQLMRYGQILASTSQGENTYVTSAKTPLWFLILLRDAFVTTVPDEQAKPAIQNLLPQWTVENLLKLLQCDKQLPDVASAFLGAIFFDRQEISDYFIKKYDAILAIHGLADYIAQHLAIFHTILNHAKHPKGLAWTLQCLGKNLDLAALSVDFLIDHIFNQPKKIAKQAEAVLMSLPNDICYAPLHTMLLEGTSKQRSLAVQIMAQQGHDKTTFENVLLTEKSKTVQEALRAAISMLSGHHQQDTEPCPLCIPPWTAKETLPLPKSATAIVLQNHQDLLAEAKKRDESDYEASYRLDSYQSLLKVSQAELEQIVPYLNGGAIMAEDQRQLYYKDICYQNRLCDLPEFNLSHLLRANMYHSAENMDYVSNHDNWSFFINKPQFHTLFANKDLRQIAHEFSQANFLNDAKRYIAETFLGPYLPSVYSATPAALIWPFFAENMVYIDEALGLAPDQSRDYRGKLSAKSAFKILQMFPALPNGYFPKLLEMALGEGKQHRQAAQQLLSNTANIHVYAQEALQSSKQEIRVCAAQWLGELNQSTAIPDLYTALKKEKREVVQAALLTALENLGEDISPYLSPETLLLDAEKGLKAKRAASFAWFDAATMPALTWQNGQAVHANIGQWWMVLSAKLKEPAGNALLQRYIALLSPQSAQDLGQYVLSLFIAHDTRSPNEADIMTHVLPQVSDPSLTFNRVSKEDVIADLRRQFIMCFSPTAIADKGILALAFAADGQWAVEVIEQYMKTHYTKRAQIEAMLMAMAQSDSPSIIRFLMSIARRYRTESVQKKAKALIAQIAERQGHDELTLADKHIATAGFGANGEQYFDYGERVFTAKLDQDMQIVLQNPDEKTIQALPVPNKNENDAMVEVAKKTFSANKSLLNKTIKLQSMRLYEAMCSKRQWTAALWQEDLLNHPIMKVLISRLVWLNVDADGQYLQSFRPCEDGSLLNLNDDEIQLPNNSKVMLAHRLLLTNEEISSWQNHYQDYKIAPLFAQFAHGMPDISQIGDSTKITEREGWQMDFTTLNNAFSKLNYERKNKYAMVFEKWIEGANIHICIDFHGDEFYLGNVPVFLGTLQFTQFENAEHHNLLIQDVPEIILAEGYTVYLAVSELGSGLNAKWKQSHY